MLKWYEENGKHLGFDEDTLKDLYKVAKDENGWYYEYLLDVDGMDGYDTAEEAMAAAEAEFAVSESMWLDQIEEQDGLLDLEDLEDTYWDRVAHERVEITKGLF